MALKIPEGAPEYSDSRVYETRLEPLLEVPPRQCFSVLLTVPPHVETMLKAFHDLRGQSLFQVCLRCVDRRMVPDWRGKEGGSEEDKPIFADDDPIFGG